MIEPGRVVGLMPAAGRATRLGLGPRSKSLVEVPDLRAPDAGPVPVCRYLLGQYAAAGIRDVRVLRRDDSHDLAAWLATGAAHEGLELEDVVTGPTPSSMHTVAQGLDAVRDRPIALGFPDIVLQPDGLCAAALAALDDGVDACIAAVPIAVADRPAWDMLAMDGDRVIEYQLKPARSDCTHGTALAVWRPSFSAFLLDWLPAEEDGGRLEHEVSLGDVFMAALEAGLTVNAHLAPSGFALDIGVPERLERAARLGLR